MGLFKRKQEQLTADEHFKKYGNLDGYVFEDKSNMKIDHKQNLETIQKAVMRMGACGVRYGSIDCYRDAQGNLVRGMI